MQREAAARLEQLGGFVEEVDEHADLVDAIRKAHKDVHARRLWRDSFRCFAKTHGGSLTASEEFIQCVTEDVQRLRLGFDTDPVDQIIFDAEQRGISKQDLGRILDRAGAAKSGADTPLNKRASNRARRAQKKRRAQADALIEQLSAANASKQESIWYTLRTTAPDLAAALWVPVCRVIGSSRVVFGPVWSPEPDACPVWLTPDSGWCHECRPPLTKWEIELENAGIELGYRLHSSRCYDEERVTFDT